MRNPQDDVAGEILEAVIRAVWAFRVELVLLVGAGMLWYLGHHLAGPIAASAALAGVVALVLVIGPIRRPLGRLFRHARLRRKWRRAIQAAHIPSLKNQVPAIRRIRDIPAGERFDVRIPPGSTVPDLDRAAEVIAAALGVREIRVRRNADNASRGEVVIARRDPLTDASLPWPHEAAPEASLWDPIPVGVDEDGNVVEVALAERNLLLGGEPGSGKSVALSLLVATAALDPDCKLWLLDGKLVELATWSRCAEGSAGVSVIEATQVLLALQAEMDQRYAELLRNGRRKVTQGDGLPLHLVVCDELAHYLTASDRKERNEFADVLRDLVSRGRAAGIVVLAATQKPSSDIIPTSIRDLFGFRWAMRCSTPQASDTILGSGWASAGYSADDIDPTSRGVGYLLHEGGIPQRLRSYYLDDDGLAAIAARAEVLRGQRSKWGEI